jgi:hypothetical protein
VKRAEIELPYTFKISRAFPETLGRACSVMWGKRDRDPWELFSKLDGKNANANDNANGLSGGKQEQANGVPEIRGIADDGAFSISDDATDGINQHELVEAEYDLGERKVKEDAVSVKKPPVYLEKIDVAVDGIESGGATIEEVDEPELDENVPTADKLVQPEEAKLINEANGTHNTQDPHNAQEPNVPNGVKDHDGTNGVEHIDSGANDKEKVNVNDSGNQNQKYYGGWGSDSPEAEEPRWGGGGDEFDEEAWGKYVIPTIFPFLGPSSLPYTYIPIRAEESTRILVDILPPDPNSLNLLVASLGVLVLQPWPHPDDDTDSMVKSPQLLTFKEDEETYSVSLAARKAAKRFDPAKDSIRVYVDPAVLTECKVGMGIGGLWVQVARRVEESEDEKGEKSSKKGKSNKAASNEWWYMESLRHAIPGYWTSNDPNRDSTRFDSNPDYAYVYSE